MRINSSFDINLNNLSFNVDLIRDESKCDLIAMVKANAYGHGILEISKFLIENKGIKTLGVASLGEALYLRQNLNTLSYQILVFSDFNLDDSFSREIITDFNIDLVLSSLDQLNSFLSYKELRQKALILKFDTGMHRLGFQPLEVQSVSSLLKKNGRSEIKHVMSHFAVSFLKEKETHPTQKQIEVFKEIIKELKTHFAIEEISISNSGGVEQKLGFEFSHVRPGLMLYGPKSYPSPSLEFKTKLISSLRTYILKKRNIKKGDPIGYGRTICPFDGVVLYLPLGYGDGILTHLSGLNFSFHGVNAYVLGRVNMDMTTLLIKSEDDKFSLNEEVYFWRENNEVLDSIASYSKTIPYFLLTSISSRLPRRFFFN